MIKILIGGSPCTFWSIAQRNNRETVAEGLGWELFLNYLIAKEKFKPDFFLYENNKSAAQPIKDQISKLLGVELMYINSALVSAQWRERFYAFNWSVEQPIDRHIFLKDVLNIYNHEPTSNRAIVSKVETKVKVRKHYIDTKKLCEFLREHKEQTAKPIKQIAEECGVTLTEAEHWFRKDKCFSIPRAEIWQKLKEAINIKTDEYDSKITEFEIKNGNFDMAKRVYHINGKHPTLTTLSGGHQKKNITDGIGTGRYCLDKMGYSNIKYYAYEIDKYAIQIANKNYPDIIQCGDAFSLREDNWSLPNLREVAL